MILYRNKLFIEKNKYNINIISPTIVMKENTIPKNLNGFIDRAAKIFKTECPALFICRLLLAIVQISIIRIVAIAVFFNMVLKRTVFSTAKTVIGITIMSIIKIDTNAEIIIKNDISNKEEFLLSNSLILSFIVSIIFFDCPHFNKCFFCNSSNTAVLIMIHFIL